MMFKSTLVSALLVAASADISSTSTAGAKLLSKARALENNNQDEYSWMAKYDLKFEGCHTIHTYGAEGQGGQENNSYPLRTQHLAKFKLCSSGSSCGMCSGGGTYMVELGDFAQAYLEAEQQRKESLCQAVEENCNCQYYNGDDQACMANCYKNAGYDFCGEDENQFDPAQYLDCAEAPFNNQNNNGYYGNDQNQYYIGPTCSGSSVKLAVFTDAQCTKKAPANTYENKTGGYKLPYSSSSMISTKCVSCKQQQENQNQQGDDANANQYYVAPEASDTCKQLYEQSAKCETNLSAKYKSYRDTGSCTYINKIVPALEKVYIKSGGGGTAGGFAVFFGLTTLGFAGAAYYFYTKVERSNINLSDKEGGNFA